MKEGVQEGMNFARVCVCCLGCTFFVHFCLSILNPQSTTLLRHKLQAPTITLPLGGGQLSNGSATVMEESQNITSANVYQDKTRPGNASRYIDIRNETNQTEATGYIGHTHHINKTYTVNDSDWGKHTLAVIVPFRDRFDELSEFIPYMNGFLNKQRIRHKFYVVNQEGKYRFNRAALINVGFKLSRQDCDYLAIHDVDLVPVNPNISYAYPALGPMHLSNPSLHPLYHYPDFMGGIIVLKKTSFEKINGMSNIFWGWGKEDDDLQLRFKSKGLKVYTPSGITTGHKTFRHLHEKERRERDTKHFIDQLKVFELHDVDSGLKDLQYILLNHQEFVIMGVHLTVFHVDIKCNIQKTPWCEVEDV